MSDIYRGSVGILDELKQVLDFEYAALGERAATLRHSCGFRSSILFSLTTALSPFGLLLLTPLNCLRFQRAGYREVRDYNTRKDADSLNNVADHGPEYGGVTGQLWQAHCCHAPGCVDDVAQRPARSTRP